MQLKTIGFEAYRSVQLDDAIREVPGWTSWEERRFNKWLLRHQYLGEGEIVELGSLYGSMTLSMAVGLRGNPREAAANRKIHAYDLFVHPDTSVPVVPGVTAGESSLEVFKGFLGDHLDRVEIHAGDVRKIGWPGRKIEYLFVDIMKSVWLGRRVALDFFPFLVPGRSLLVHQDFKHFFAHWVHVMMFRLRRHFEPRFDIPDSSSFVFASMGRVTTEEIESACDYASLTLDEIDEVFEYSERFVEPDVRRWRVRAAKVMALLHLYEKDVARDVSRESALRQAQRVHAEIPAEFRADSEYQRYEQSVRRHLRVGEPASETSPDSFADN